jgi:hypothetical protein
LNEKVKPFFILFFIFKILGISGNPGWVSRDSLEKIANSLLYNELSNCNFLQGVRKLLKTEVFSSFLLLKNKKMW